MGRTFEILRDLGVADQSTQRLFANGTRDATSLPVYRDNASGVIYIDDYYVGDEEYASGDYRRTAGSLVGVADYERQADLKRRMLDYNQFYIGRDIVDFGCGEGDFLRAAAPHARSASGIELQVDAAKALIRDGIPCHPVVPLGAYYDAVFCFHVLEHLPEPIETLSTLRQHIRPGGIAVVEVPHANDLLMFSEQFKHFTLWSQHLVLHTRESLTRLLSRAGFSEIVVQGKQRYPLSNHLQWLLQGRPGGHKSTMSALDSPELRATYEAALQKINATDTLVAICQN